MKLWVRTKTDRIAITLKIWTQDQSGNTYRKRYDSASSLDERYVVRSVEKEISILNKGTENSWLDSLVIYTHMNSWIRNWRERKLLSIPRNLTDFVRSHLNKAPQSVHERLTKHRMPVNLLSSTLWPCKLDEPSRSSVVLFASLVVAVCVYMMMLITAELLESRRRNMITWLDAP